MNKPRTIQTEEYKEHQRKKASEWYAKYPERAKWSREFGYLANRDDRMEKCRAYARLHPHINKEAVKKWQNAHPDQDPKEYRLTAQLRERCLNLWGNQCGMCHRYFEKMGSLRSIAHHQDYQPIERIVYLCYQCHNLIHGRKCYWHPFVKLGGESLPTMIQTALSQLDDRVIEIKRIHPRSLKTINVRAKYKLVLFNKHRAVNLENIIKEKK